MISYLTKRNGRKVKFQPERLNKLANWATDQRL